MLSSLFVSMPSPLLPLVRTQSRPPAMLMLPSALIPLGDEVSLPLLYWLPVVTTYTLPPLKLASPSVLMPLPPAPVLFSHSSPPFMVSVPSALMPAAPLASPSSLS